MVTARRKGETRRDYSLQAKQVGRTSGWPGHDMKLGGISGILKKIFYPH